MIIDSSDDCGELETNDGDGFNFNAIGEVLHDLIMWKDVSKSSLWFGLGSISFLSSCFVKGVNFRYAFHLKHLVYLMKIIH